MCIIKFYALMSPIYYLLCKIFNFQLYSEWMHYTQQLLLSRIFPQAKNYQGENSYPEKQNKDNIML